MIFALIGHRGVGKSTLLTRIAGYYRDADRKVTTLDLDHEIATRAQLPVFEIFRDFGEAHFRALEQSTLRELVNSLRETSRQHDIYIAVGAGFSGELPPEVHAVWIRRETDSHGRIFVDRERPRLSNAAPRKEYLERFAAREASYRERCHDIFCLREGVDGTTASPAQAVERAFVMSTLAKGPLPVGFSIGGVVSLLPEDLRKRDAADWIARRLAWPDMRFELRDDLFDDDALAQAMALIPVSRRIFSFRRAKQSSETRKQQAAAEALWDFPLELLDEESPHAPPILSLHERLRDESIEAAATRLEREGTRLAAGILKFAVEVHNFAELAAGFRWAGRAPARRAFLPRSPADRPSLWRWFRLLTGPLSPLAFFREGDGTSLDQPLVAEWWQIMALGGGSGRFAAVLGDPIAHSRTPIEHAEFFAHRAMPVFAISLREAELVEGLEVLRELGLRDAAVTAPLKRGVAAILHARGDLSSEIESVNTLYYSESRQRFFAQNTDLEGATALLGTLAESRDVAVWGGGGTLPVLRAVLPHARYFSSRTGQDRDPPKDRDGDDGWQPQVVVWASGSAAEGGFPDVKFRPHTVYDLSYSEDSAGREYALRCAARYVSGLQMFVVQAAAQRAFFSAAEQDLGDSQT